MSRSTFVAPYDFVMIYLVYNPDFVIMLCRVCNHKCLAELLNFNKKVIFYVIFFLLTAFGSLNM